MAAPLGPLSEAGAEISLLETNQELQSQLEKSKQDFQDLKEKFLISEATAYSLANQLQKYKCDQCTDIVASVLEEKVPSEKGTRADTAAEKLRQCHLLIKHQDKELARVYEKLREGKEVAQLLSKHLEDLLTLQAAEHSQGQAFQEQLAEGRRLAERLARKLSPESQDDRGEGNGEHPMCPSREQQEVEQKEVLQDTVDACVWTPSIREEGCESHQCYTDGKFPSDNQEFGSALDIASECSHSKGDETPRGPPENQMDQEGLKGQESVAPRLSRQLLEVGEQDTSWDSPDQCYLPYSVLSDLSDSYWPYRSAAIFAPEYLEACSSLEVAKNQFHPEEEEDQDLICPRLSTKLPEEEEQDAPWDSLDECYLTYSALPVLSDAHGTSRRADISSFEHLNICSPLEVTKSHNDLLEEEDQDPIYPSPPCDMRLHRELPEAEENEVPQYSLDECYLTSSVGHDSPDTWRPYTNASSPCEQQETFLGPDVDALTQAPCHQGTLNANLTLQRAEVQTSGAQTQPGTQVAASLRFQLDQQLDCGDNRARLGLSSTITSLDTMMGSGNQWLLFQELALDACISMKGPPKPEGDAGEGSGNSYDGCPVFDQMKALGVMKEKIPKRKLQFGKWRLACRF